MTANIITLAGNLFQRAKLAVQAGITFEGARDLYDKLGYKKFLVFSDYWGRYERGGIAARVVDAYPQATWRNAPAIIEVGVSAADSEFVNKFNALEKKLKLFHYLERADRLSGIGAYGILVIGVSKSGGLENPLMELRETEEVIYLSTYTEINAKINGLISDPQNPLFGQPESYQISLFSNTTVSAETSLPTVNKDIHHSRVIHLAEGLDEDEVFGRPRMRRVWNYLDDLDKIAGGTAEAVWLTADRGIQFDIDKDAVLDDQDKEDMADEIDEYMHGMKRFLRTQGIKANVLGSDVPDPRGAFLVTTSLIAGTVSIPQRVLFGSERGQMAGNQDERNFNSHVIERQTSYAEPKILRPLIDKLISIKALPNPKRGYRVKWPDPSTMTAKELSDVAARNAQAIRNIATQTKEGQLVVSAGEFRETFLGLPREIDSED